MSERDDGGPVHPVMGYKPRDDHYGLTLRDWFAGQALAGLAAKAEDESVTARQAYILADAMLQVRGES